MKKGKWNYTQDILFQVVNVVLGPAESIPLHWQNAFQGETIQAVLIRDFAGYEFLIDNEDGSGLLKISRGGGPDSYSAHIDGKFEIGCTVPEEKWNQWDEHVSFLRREFVDAWREEHYPEEFRKLQALKASIPPHFSKNLKR